MLRWFVPLFAALAIAAAATAVAAQSVTTFGIFEVQNGRGRGLARNGYDRGYREGLRQTATAPAATSAASATVTFTATTFDAGTSTAIAPPTPGCVVLRRRHTASATLRVCSALSSDPAASRSRRTHAATRTAIDRGWTTAAIATGTIRLVSATIARRTRGTTGRTVRATLIATTTARVIAKATKRAIDRETDGGRKR